MRAHALLEAARQRAENLDDQGSYRLVKAAFLAAPEYLPAIYRISQMLDDRLSVSERLRFFAHVRGLGPADSACLAFSVREANPDLRRQLRDLDGLERRFGVTDCTTWLRVSRERALPVAARPARLFATDWPRLMAASGGAGDLWWSYAQTLASSGDTAAALSVADGARRRDLAPHWRFRIDDLVIAIDRARGDAAAATAVRHAETDWVARHPTPEVRYAVYFVGWERRLVVGPDSLDFARSTAIARAHHATWHLVSGWLAYGGMLHDTGHASAARRLFQLALTAADSAGWQPARLHALVWLGRSYVTSGEWRDAVRVLHRAAQICDPGDLYYSAAIHHYLAHAYERAGRMKEAVAEIDRFVAIADSMPTAPAHMISLYDAGVIKWEAGLHAAARLDFRAMVHVVDATRHNYFYAGDYYERIGDLTRALAYYRKVPYDDAEEGARALSGLAHVYDALGMPDSAEAAARMHDREEQTLGQVPLLPGVLARHGRVAEALRISRAWADSQATRGNVRGAIRAELQLSRLLLDEGGASGALDQARAAGVLAAGANFPEERARAMTLQAGAELVLHRTGDAVRDAGIAVREARDQGTDADRRDAQTALGDALAASGDARSALSAYDAAARMVESMGTSVTADLTRATYHARQLELFDRAVRLVLALPPSHRRTAELVRWSQRRNGAAYPGVRSPRPPLDLTRIKARLGAHRVLVDYVVLDRRSAAIVVTASRAVVVGLPAGRATIAALVDSVRRPYSVAYLGRVDLARAVPDAKAAAALSRLLLQPVLPYLAGYSDVTIVPDGPLYLLPFDLLPLDDSTLVVDRYAVSLLPAVRLLAATGLRRIPTSRASLLLVGGAAPGAAREVRAVRGIWEAAFPDQRHSDHDKAVREPVRVLAEDSATESAIRAALPRYTVLHFATHAVVDASDPLDSHLVLAPDRAAAGGSAVKAVDDGLFHLSEIEETPSQAQLVVLSACESENGRSFEGTGPMGLARAFLVAGARAVVATRWPVAATAADLMSAFYTRLVAGDPPDEALRSAKETVRHNPGTGNPFNWAAFVVVGNAGFRLGG